MPWSTLGPNTQRSQLCISKRTRNNSEEREPSGNHVMRLPVTGMAFKYGETGITRWDQNQPLFLLSSWFFSLRCFGEQIHTGARGRSHQHPSPAHTKHLLHSAAQINSLNQFLSCYQSQHSSRHGSLPATHGKYSGLQEAEQTADTWQHPPQWLHCWDTTCHNP